MDGGSCHCTGGSDQDHRQEKKCKQGKCLSEEVLHIAEKRRETKGKEEKERYIHLNAEFQRISRRDKKTFLHVNVWQKPLQYCKENSLQIK